LVGYRQDYSLNRNKVFKYLSSAILSILGWKIEGEFPHEEKKLIIVVMHHTSNWDFPLGLLVRSKLGFEANFAGKSSLFKPPFGFIFRWLGGYPVERDPSKKKGSLTDSMIRLYEREPKLRITFTPEGTRSKVTKLKTGFWTIAKTADVPLLYINFDGPSKSVKIDKVQKAKETFDEQYASLKAYFGNSKGIKAELSYTFE